MATTRPFAYNTGTTINGTTQVGTLAVGTTSLDYSTNPGGVKWWMGPDEELGYVIAKSVPSNSQTTPVGVNASVGFERSTSLTDNSFIDLANIITNQGFTGATQASTWLTANGYWNSYASTPSYVTSGLSLHLDAGNVASYPGTGTTWTSLVGGYTGSTGTGVGYSSSNGGVLTFNGATTAFVNMYTSARSIVTGATNNFSIECWYQSNNNRPEIAATGAGSNGWVFGYFASTGTAWKVTKYGVTDLSGGVIPQNTSWHHAVLTYSSTTGTRVYIDGSLSGTAIANTQNLAGGSSFSIGKGESTSYMHNGNIAIFRWYSSVLSASDVSQNFNADKTRFGL